MSVSIRAAHQGDALATGAILAAFQHQTGWMPVMYSQDEAMAFCRTMIRYGWMRVAQIQGDVRGFIARDGEEICGLYVAQNARRQGIGTALVQDARVTCSRLWLRVHQINRPARAFYAGLGFTEHRAENAPRNDEGLPELTCLWTAKGAS